MDYRRNVDILTETEEKTKRRPTKHSSNYLVTLRVTRRLSAERSAREITKDCQRVSVYDNVSKLMK